MVALLIALSIMAMMLTVAMPVWKQLTQREKEEELVFRGQQYARAVGLFMRKYANASPPSIDALVQQKFLRRKYKDPITRDDFLPILVGQSAPGVALQNAAQGGRAGQPAAGRGTQAQATGSPAGAPGVGPVSGGGIIGVASKSKDASIRIFNGRTHYNEWAFVYIVPTLAPGVGGAPGPTAPGRGGQGQRGGQQGQQAPAAGPFGRGGQNGPGRGGNNGPEANPGRFGSGATPQQPGAPFTGGRR
ncbi:MAG: type II secretion system protein [Acidobacteria bacterium]|nr:type II secretion system protein [Acidobacteriota bacterium]